MTRFEVFPLPPPNPGRILLHDSPSQGADDGLASLGPSGGFTDPAEEVTEPLRDYREKVVEPPEQSGNDRLTLSTVGVNVNQP